MLNIKIIRDWDEKKINRLIDKDVSRETLEKIKSDDEKLLELKKEVDDLKAKRNTLSKQIGEEKTKGNDERAADIMSEASTIGEKIDEIESVRNKLTDEMIGLLEGIPNVPHDSVPVGNDEDDNVLVRTWGEPKKFDFDPKEHFDVTSEINLELGAKLAGARFTVLEGKIAKLERALINFMLDNATDNGYSEVMVPYIVKSEMLYGTGQLPKFADDVFKLDGQEKYLIPTAEVPITNFYFDTIVDGDELPLSYTAFTPCFRSEAGSAGRDTKGLVRLHQFHKVELVKFSKQEDGEDNLERLTQDAESVLQKLNLPYRVVTLCTGDLGFSSCKTYDIEVWMPGQNKYREISSCSLMTDFQARRAMMRYRDGDEIKYLYTLNGSGVAVGRALAAIVENYQLEDGDFEIPEALKKYM